MLSRKKWLEQSHGESQLINVRFSALQIKTRHSKSLAKTKSSCDVAPAPAEKITATKHCRHVHSRCMHGLRMNHNMVLNYAFHNHVMFAKQVHPNICLIESKLHNAFKCFGGRLYLLTSILGELFVYAHNGRNITE
jgi:hypothetical protein